MDQTRFIDYKALVFVKLSVVLTNTPFGGVCRFSDDSFSLARHCEALAGVSRLSKMCASCLVI
jgi:hypothetical protein